MFKNKFNLILNKDEEILWCNNVNVHAATQKDILPFCIILIPILIAPPILVSFIMTQKNTLYFLKYFCIFHVIFWLLFLLISFFVIRKKEKNTYFCITNERIIKRTGAFNNTFVHYSLQNVGTVNVVGGLFDGQDENPSANLIISVKDFHTNVTTTRGLVIVSLNNAYEAYRTLNELTKGNNEVLRIKTE